MKQLLLITVMVLAGCGFRAKAHIDSKSSKPVEIEKQLECTCIDVPDQDNYKSFDSIYEYYKSRKSCEKHK